MFYFTLSFLIFSAPASAERRRPVERRDRAGRLSGEARLPAQRYGRDSPDDDPIYNAVMRFLQHRQ